MLVLDYTTRIPPWALRGAGVTGVCRYIAPQAWKVIQRPEYVELLNAGIEVTLNWESSADDWLGGAGAGGFHAANACDMAKALGYPVGSVIVGSADIDMGITQWFNAGRGYANAFAAQIRKGGYRPGVYGPWNVLEWVKNAGFMDAFWQAGMSTAWSGGLNAQPWPGAHLRQRRHMMVAGIDTDVNDVLIPHWGSATIGGSDVNLSDPLGPGPSGSITVNDALSYGAKNAENAVNLGNTINGKLDLLLAHQGSVLTDAQIATLAKELAAQTNPAQIEAALRNVLLKGVAQ